jgi:hypothetical protein
VKLDIDLDTLRPLVEAVVAETLARLEAQRQKLPGRLCYSEEEAARLLGVKPNVLRDARHRGEITASAIVCRRIRYLESDLTTYLLGRRWEANGDKG